LSECESEFGGFEFESSPGPGPGNKDSSVTRVGYIVGLIS